MRTNEEKTLGQEHKLQYIINLFERFKIELSKAIDSIQNEKSVYTLRSRLNLWYETHSQMLVSQLGLV